MWPALVAEGFMLDPPGYERLSLWTHVLTHLLNARTNFECVRDHAVELGNLGYSLRQQAFFIAGIMAYGRCYASSGPSIPKLNAKKVYEGSEDGMAVHRRLIELRNTIAAHTDKSDLVRLTLALKDEPERIIVRHLATRHADERDPGLPGGGRSHRALRHHRHQQAARPPGIEGRQGDHAGLVARRTRMSVMRYRFTGPPTNYLPLPVRCSLVRPASAMKRVVNEGPLSKSACRYLSGRLGSKCVLMAPAGIDGGDEAVRKGAAQDDLFAALLYQHPFAC